MELIKASGLTFAYPGQKPLWEDLSFSLQEGSFSLLLGPAGAGKSSLLRHFVHRLKPFGRSSGTIFYAGTPLEELKAEEHVRKVAFVMQDPEDQIVCDSVWHELAFALENLGLPEDEMRLRIAEVANFFGIQTWFHRRSSELSGGQKRLLNLASVMVLRPELLVLDEPLSQLDPIAAADFTALLLRVNQELGVTILITDHNLSELLEPADQILFLEQGRLSRFGSAKDFSDFLLDQDHPFAQALPASCLISHAAAPDKTVFTVLKARLLLEEAVGGQTLRMPPFEDAIPADDFKPYLRVKNFSFRYNIRENPVLDHLNLEIPEGKISFIMGGNASGKSTLLLCLAGVLKGEGGRIKISDPKAHSAAFLPQNPRLLFTAQSLRDDFRNRSEIFDAAQKERLRNLFTPEEKTFRIESYLERFGLGPLLSSHPADLSGGELQRAGLAAVLLQAPRLLLLDEPAKALSAADKEQLGKLLRRLSAAGITVIAVSHDLNFASRFADYCILLFNGDAVAAAEPREFFTGHYFYTCETCRIAGRLLPEALYPEEVIRAWHDLQG